MDAVDLVVLPAEGIAAEVVTVGVVAEDLAPRPNNYGQIRRFPNPDQMSQN